MSLSSRHAINTAGQAALFPIWIAITDPDLNSESSPLNIEASASISEKDRSTSREVE